MSTGAHIDYIGPNEWIIEGAHNRARIKKDPDLNPQHPWMVFDDANPSACGNYSLAQFALAHAYSLATTGIFELME